MLRSLSSNAVVFLAVALCCGDAASQPPRAADARVAGAQSAPAAPGPSWKPHRTPDGQPDLQGTWVNFDSTPFEADEAARPASDVNPPSHWMDHDSPQSKT